MTPETAWAEAMKYENRADPYPFFDELRKTPVARVANGIYAVTGYRELLTLAHDPRVSSDLSRSSLTARPAAEPESEPDPMEGYAQAQSMIASDPPDHDRMRRMAMRHFGPPHSPDVIPKMEPECHRIVNALLDKARGKTRIDVVDEYAYPLPVTVICKIMGVPLKDEAIFHAWIADGLAGIDFGPEAATEEGQVRAEKGRAGVAAFKRYMTGLIEGWVREPGEGMISKMLHDDGPDGPMSPGRARAGRGSTRRRRFDSPRATPLGGMGGTREPRPARAAGGRRAIVARRGKGPHPAPPARLTRHDSVE